MAFGVRKVYPNDLRPRVAIGVNIPFSTPGVFQPNYQTRDAIKNNLINYFLTNPGERIENPLFGAGLRAYIFKAISLQNFDFIKEDIQEKIRQNFPNIEVDEVEVIRTTSENTIQINITYSIPNTGINDTLELNFA
jgi:phage baseplate assembly protein W|tara:strand:+ start:3155 stop:3562 length:408 start_codon:yes stop_codon:yes gene_type:complete